jgi:hypothetical protein
MGDNDFWGPPSNLHNRIRSNNMASEKMTYWMAVGLLALVMGNHFVSRINGTCLASKARVTAERISGQATQLMAIADVMLGRTSARFDRAEAAMAMAQVQVASMQTQMARGEAACARLEAGRARMVMLREMRMPVLRPRVEMIMPRPVAAPSADPI